MGAFLGSKLGMYLILAVAICAFVGTAVYKIHHDGYEEGVAEYKPKYDDLVASNEVANTMQQQAQATATAQQQQVVTDLTKAFQEAMKKPPLVITKRIVIHDVQQALDSSCTISNAFVWMRDRAFHPDYPDVTTVPEPAPAAPTPGPAVSTAPAKHGLNLTRPAGR